MDDETTFLAIAFKIAPGLGLKWLDENKNNMIETMKLCNINNIEIIDNGVNSSLPAFNESFEISFGSLPISDIKQNSFIVLFGIIQGDVIPDELRDKVQCFYNNFFTFLVDTMGKEITAEDYQKGTAIMLYKFTGQLKRAIIFQHSIQPEQPIDCSEYEAKNKALQRELSDCQASKTKLEQENESIISKLDALREQTNQFKSKDPVQLRQNIANLQSELEEILRELEQQQRQQEQQRQEQPDNCRSFGKTPNPPCLSKADYKKQSVIFHPDKNTGCPLEAEAKFKLLGQICSEVNEANGGSKTYKKNKKNINKKKSRRSYKKTRNKRHPSKKRHVSK